RHPCKVLRPDAGALAEILDVGLATEAVDPTTAGSRERGTDGGLPPVHPLVASVQLVPGGHMLVYGVGLEARVQVPRCDRLRRLGFSVGDGGGHRFVSVAGFPMGCYSSPSSRRTDRADPARAGPLPADRARGLARRRAATRAQRPRRRIA